MELNQLRTCILPVITVNSKSSLGQQCPFLSSSYQSFLLDAYSIALVSVSAKMMLFLSRHRLWSWLTTPGYLSWFKLSPQIFIMIGWGVSEPRMFIFHFLLFFHSEFQWKTGFQRMAYLELFIIQNGNGFQTCITNRTCLEHFVFFSIEARTPETTVTH
jgi:hypothetical protein